MNKKMIQIIAHRGLPYLYCQNTLQSISAALPLAHLVQFDVMLTRDNHPIIFHDRGLDATTNIRAKPQFQNRKYSHNYDAVEKHQEDWWVQDMDLTELMELVVRQRHSYRPMLESNICTLDQVMTLLKDKKGGFLIEIKSHYEYKNSQRDQILVDKIIQCMEKYNLQKEMGYTIKIQSFNHRILKRLYEKGVRLPFYHLYDKKIQINEELIIKDKLPNSEGIGITVQHLKNGLAELCKKYNLKIYFWTVADDHPKIPLKMQNYKQVYRHLIKEGVDGIITQFPQNCLQVIKEFNN